jgi:hypothetical protein
MLSLNLRRRSSLVTFLLIVNLSPVPLRPGAVARRVGLTSRTTIRALVKEAVLSPCSAASSKKDGRRPEAQYQ